MVMLAGTVAADGFPLERVTSAPPAGARPSSVTVPVAGLPPSTVLGLSEIEAIQVGVTERTAVAIDRPFVAVIVAVPDPVAPAVVIVNVVELAPPGTVTVAGTLASALEELKDSGYPPVGAGPLSVTVALELFPPATLVGDKERVEITGAATVSDAAMVTPADVAVTLTNVALATGYVEKTKEAEFAPTGTRTLTGSEITDGGVEPRRTVTPPVGATSLRYTVPPPLPI